MGILSVPMTSSSRGTQGTHRKGRAGMYLSHKAHAQLALVQSPMPPIKPKKYDTNE